MENREESRRRRLIKLRISENDENRRGKKNKKGGNNGKRDRRQSCQTYLKDGNQKQGTTARLPTGRKEMKKKSERRREQNRATQRTMENIFGARKARTAIKRKSTQTKGKQRKAQARKPSE